MVLIKIMVAGLALSVTAAAPGGSSATIGLGAAERIHQLDIMLMVGSLRCRNTRASLEAEYDEFARRFELERIAAGRSLERELEQALGADEARHAMDRMRVSLANTYGQGHPWLACEQLREATARLLIDDRPDALLRTADELLAGKRLAYGLVALGDGD